MIKRVPYIKFFQVVCCLSATFLFYGNAFATSRVTTNSGLWSDPTTWSPSGVPSSSDNVSIAAGQVITLDSDMIVHALTINSGGTLSLNAGTNLSIGGSFTINGTVTMNGGDIQLTTGGSAFVLGANSSFTWEPGDNTSAGASLFTSSIESFASSSTLIIKKWYNYAVPIGSVITGNFGNLTLNSPSASNTIVEWNQNNTLQAHQVTGTLTIDQGWITLDKSSSITNTTIGNIVLTSVNSSFYAHNGTHNSSFIITTNSVTNNGGAFYGLNDGNGNVTINVSNDFSNIGNVKIINNSGASNVSNGNATFNVGGTFSQSTGDTRIIYNVTTLNSGTYTSSFGNLLLNGGIFMGQTACHVGGGLCSMTVLNSFVVNFSNATDKFRGTSLSTIGTTKNNARFNLTVGGILSLNGVTTSEFTSSAASGSETISVNGAVQLNGTTASFNYGTTAASHDLSMIIGGDLLVNGSTSYLSHNGGAASISISGSVSVSTGSVTVKGDTGIANITVNGAFTQSGGNFYLHNNTLNYSTNSVTMNIYGDFTQSSGSLSFDNNSSSLSATNTINLGGANYFISGSGLIRHAGSGTSTSFGQLNFARAGTINYSRTATTHFIQQVKQTVNSGCTLNVVSGNIQVTSHSNLGTDYFRIATGGTVAANYGQFISNALSANTGIQVDSGGTVKTSRNNGFYDGSLYACINAGNNFDYYLDANSTVEYTGYDNQVLTGIGIGLATTNNHKYGILKINFNGTDDGESVAPVSSNVYVRTQLNLAHGELNLNGNTLTIESGASTAVTRTGGYVKSEIDSAINTSVILWKNISSGPHEFPFGAGSTDYIPVIFTPISGFGGDVTISTRSTPGSDNLPFPVTSTTSPASNAISFDNDVSTTNVIDRWWNISAPGFTADLTLTYCGEENTLPPSENTTTMSIIQWNGTAWSDPAGTGYGTVSGTGNVTATGISFFSNFVITSHFHPLPIQLATFNAIVKDNAVQLNWTTAIEINNDYFSVERSGDGKNFESIQKIKGAGNSTSYLDYETTDANPMTGTSYYRIRQTDFDGRFHYSDIKAVNVHPMQNNLLSIVDFGPNPFKNNFHLTYHAEKAAHVTFELSNMTGRRMHASEAEATEGNNLYEFSEGDELEQGTYILNISCNGNTITQKIIKK